MTQSISANTTPTADDIKIALATKGFTGAEIDLLLSMLDQLGGPDNAKPAIEALDRLDKAA